MKTKEELQAKTKEDLKALRNKSKGFIGEFKTFIARGNVMDLAVGVIIGAAFQNIVTALTDSFINPLIKVFTGGAGEDGITIGGVFRINGIEFNYGSFLTAVINFIIMAFILFMLIRFVNRLMAIGKKEEEVVAEEPVKPEDVQLLAEIRDILKKQK